MVQTKPFQDYQLKGNPIVQLPVPMIGNLIYDDLGELVIARLNERFKGKTSIEYPYEHKHKTNEPLSYSNIPRALAINQILIEETNGGIRLLSPIQVVQYFNSIPNKESTYADTNSVSLYPNQGVNESLRLKVLGIIGKDHSKSEIPLIVSNLGVEPSDDDYRFTFTETSNIEVIEAPFLTKDGRISYSKEKGKLMSSDEGVYVYTSSDQSGLRGLYRNMDSGLSAGNGVLLDSSVSGRVQVFQDPKGLDENLEKKIRELQENKQRTVEKIETRYNRALRLLKTGKI